MESIDQDWDDNSRMAITSLLQEKIEDYQPFQGSVIHFPINETLLGEMAPDKVQTHLQNMVSTASMDPHQLVHVFAWIELLMASNQEARSRFIEDDKVRSMLLSLNDNTGWVLNYGSLTEAATARFKSERIEVLPVEERFELIRFIQFILRYALIYGNIIKGDLHKLEHFLEDHAPMVITICRRLTAMEKIFILACRALGLPVVSSADNEFETGGIVHCRDEHEMTEVVMQLPNLRVRRKRNQILTLPFECDPIHLSEEINDFQCWGGDGPSFFVVRNQDSGDGFEAVEGEGKTIGIVIDVGDTCVDLSATLYLERVSSQFPSYIKGVHSYLGARKPRICYRSGMDFQPLHLAQALYEILKTEFMIDRVKVRVLLDEKIPSSLRKAVSDYKNKRAKHLRELTEENADFCMCVRCRSFALDHACVITPERPPICGKSYDQIRTSALLDDLNTTGYFKKHIRSFVIDKGKCIEPVKGEYLGANKMVAQVTGGNVERVFLHSIAEFAHTSCSCFQGIAFYLNGMDGIGIMHRSFKGVCPDGRSWNDLAAEAGGKQGKKVAGIALSYLNSKKFLQGDGGWDMVVWMPKTLVGKYAPEGHAIATEEDASNINELERFLKSNSPENRPSTGT